MNEHALPCIISNSRVIRMKREEVTTAAAPRTTADPRVIAAIECIRAGPFAYRTVSDLACLVNVSESHFRRLFSASVGIPAKRFLLREKLAAAAVQIHAGEPVKAVAALCGFKSVPHFRLAFKGHHGWPPSECRKRPEASSPIK
ncbi:MAG: helix-turn-helix transcriptional regulator [Bryobacterales bacterium]|nr:helix-turn-helix transcriptional regulator [Bryobacterales bacterium]